MNRYGSRKFVVTMSIVLVTLALAWNGKVDANVALVLSACVAAYNAANVIWQQKNGA